MVAYSARRIVIARAIYQGSLSSRRVTADGQRLRALLGKIKSLSSKVGKALALGTVGIAQLAAKSGFKTGQFVIHEVVGLLKFLGKSLMILQRLLAKTIKLTGCLETEVKHFKMTPECEKISEDWITEFKDAIKIPILAAMIGAGPPIVLSMEATQVAELLGVTEATVHQASLSWKGIGLAMLAFITNWVIPTVNDPDAPPQQKAMANAFATVIPKPMMEGHVEPKDPVQFKKSA